MKRKLTLILGTGVGMGLIGCSKPSSQNSQVLHWGNFGHPTLSIEDADAKEMGLYKPWDSQQFCKNPNEKEFHIKKRSATAPWDPLYGYVCINSAEKKVTLYDQNEGCLGQGVFTDSTLLAKEEASISLQSCSGKTAYIVYRELTLSNLAGKFIRDRFMIKDVANDSIQFKVVKRPLAWESHFYELQSSEGAKLATFSGFPKYVLPIRGGLKMDDFQNLNSTLPESGNLSLQRKWIFLLGATRALVDDPKAL